MVLGRRGPYDLGLTLVEETLGLDLRRVERGQLLNAKASLMIHLGQLDAAWQVLEEADGLARGDDHLLAEVSVTKTSVHVDRGDAKRTLQAAQIGIKRAKRAGAPHLIGDCLWATGVALRDLGHTEKAKEVFQRAEALFARIGDRMGEAGCHQSMGLLLQGTGELELALQRHEKAAAIHRDHGYLSGLGTPLCSMGSVRISTVRLDEAEQPVRRWASSSRGAWRWPMCWCRAASLARPPKSCCGSRITTATWATTDRSRSR